MTANNCVLMCCHHFAQEVAAVQQGHPELAQLRLKVYTASCVLGPREEKECPSPFSSLGPETTRIVIGGGCLDSCGLTEKSQAPGQTWVLAPQQCFYLVAPRALVDSLLAEGAYLLTPGWLTGWREHLATWGFDRATAREFFAETTSRLVLLDTGVHGDCRPELAAMAQYLDLPSQIIPVGLDLLRLALGQMALRATGQPPATLAPPDTFFSDHLMLLELISELMAAKDEQEAIGRVQDTFAMLFAPGRLAFHPHVAGEGLDLSIPEDAYRWSESGQGFWLRLRHQGQYLGELEVDDLAFAQYKERYLTLAVPLSQVCALAIHSAREKEARAMADQALRQMASIVESSDDAILGMTMDGVIATWNRGAQGLLGYASEEVLGRHISIMLPTDQPDNMPRILEKVKGGTKVEQFEFLWRAKDGSNLDVSLTVSPIQGQGGSVAGASVIARDITESKRKAEAERRSLEEQLVQAQKLESVGKLAGGVAHDFNNMLAVILGFTEMALQDQDLSEFARQSMEQVNNAGNRAKDLTKQLLAFARKQVMQAKNISLNQVVSGFEKMLKRLIGEDIEVVTHLAPDIREVSGDPSMMEQIILNLAVNARDAMPDGGTLTIETKMVTLDKGYALKRPDVVPGEYVMLAVSDTGAGMDQETSRRIFEPFFTTKARGEGTGLGLSTVYGIVKQHEGNIWVYSEPGAGTTFKVYLPVSQTQGLEKVKTEAEAPAPKGGETLLLVEDDPSLRRLIQTALPRSGYKVLAASTPEEARKICTEFQGTIHLLLTDVVLPQMNGRELYDVLAPMRPQMDVLFMSGYTENVIAHRGVLEEGINFIQKPFSVRVLATKVGQVLGKKPAQDQAAG